MTFTVLLFKGSARSWEEPSVVLCLQRAKQRYPRQRPQATQWQLKKLLSVEMNSYNIKPFEGEDAYTVTPGSRRSRRRIEPALIALH
jgi:hypothetical protein